MASGFYVPLAWTEESVTLPESLQKEVSAIIKGSDGTALFIRYFGLIVGSALVVWCSVLLTRRARDRVEITVRWRYADQAPLLQ